MDFTNPHIGYLKKSGRYQNVLEGAIERITKRNFFKLKIQISLFGGRFVIRMTYWEISFVKF